MYNLDSPDPVIPPHQPYLMRYRAYVQSYIKRPGTPESPFWVVVAATIRDGRQRHEDVMEGSGK